MRFHKNWNQEAKFMGVRFSSPYTCNSRLDLWQQPKHTVNTYSIIAHTCRFLTSLQAASFL